MPITVPEKLVGSSTTTEMVESSTVVPLCEYHYFKRLDLICYSCNTALRGPYITALGRKYHLEHFTCSACHKVFETDESFYEHDEEIFCHYHYSTIHASKCEGCACSILKQFVEVYRGGRTQHWHPECYMVHKFWNIIVTLDCLALPTVHNGTIDLKELSHDELFEVENKMENTVMTMWMTLSSFEESTAACISDMLQHASTGDYTNGLMATARLVLKIQCLFAGIDSLGIQDLIHKQRKRISSNNGTAENDTINSEDDSYKYQLIGKEPRSLSGKLMTYLSVLRKYKMASQNQLSPDNGKTLGGVTQELLAIVTGLAHYLKLMIRNGLSNSLQCNKDQFSTIALDNFLENVQYHENIPSDPFPTLGIQPSATDSCVTCGKSIENACIRFQDLLWHRDCFTCSDCDRPLKDELEDSLYDVETSKVICIQCATHYPNAKYGYEDVTYLSQMIYLLKIALIRSRLADLVMIQQKQKHGHSHSQSASMNNKLKSQSSSNLHDANNLTQRQNEGYTQTLQDIRTIRSSLVDRELSKSVTQKARMSRVVATPYDEQKGVITGSSQEQLAKSPRSIGTSPSQKSYNESPKMSRSLRIEEEMQDANGVRLGMTSDLLKNEKSLTLDDIPRIVAAEQAREQRPNAFRHQKTLPLNYPKPKAIGTIGHGSLQNRLRKQGKSKFFAELTPAEHFILRHIAVVLIKHYTGDQFTVDQLLLLIPTRKPLTFWGKVGKSFGGNSSGPSPNGKQVFGLSIDVLTENYGTDSSHGVSPKKLRIPAFVDDSISALRQMDMSIEGIFRKNGNIKRLRELTELVDKNPNKSPDFAKENAVNLAALFKKWLRELPDPLMTFKLYDLWIHSQKISNLSARNKFIHLVYCMLPISYRDLIEVLLFFFKWVASFSQIDENTGSKMDSHNLSTVITPNILYAQSSNIKDTSNAAASIAAAAGTGESYFLGIEVVDSLIEHHDYFCHVPTYLLDIAKKSGLIGDDDDDTSEEITTKEIITKCETYLKSVDVINIFEKPDDFDNLALGLDNGDEVDRPNTVRLNTDPLSNMAKAETVSE